MTHATVQWKADSQRRVGVKPPKPTLDKYTHRGTERLVREDEIRTPSEGFERQFGADLLATLRRQSSLLRKGETADGVTLIRRTRAPGVHYTFTFQRGARTIFVTLKGRDVVCFGCDAPAAAVHASRTEYGFEPAVDRSKMTLDEKLALLKRWAFQVKRHQAVIERMNYDMTFAPTKAKTLAYEAYARTHGLRITKTVVDL